MKDQYSGHVIFAIVNQDASSYLERTGPPGPGLLALLPFLLPPYSLPRSLPWSMLLLRCLILSPSELWELAGLVGVEECSGPPPPPFLPETWDLEVKICSIYKHL